MDEESMNIPMTQQSHASMPTLPSISMEVEETAVKVADSRKEITSTKRRSDEDLSHLLPAPQESLLSFWKRKLVKENNKHPEFDGRLNPLPLYVHLNQPKGQLDQQQVV
jgi:hypothetical protein